VSNGASAGTGEGNRILTGAGIAGSIAEAEGPNQVTFYIEVDDPQSFP
jgi:hypothetical protein